MKETKENSEQRERKNRGELAADYFFQGYNCTQAVVLAFADVLPIDRKNLMKLSCSFGGGMGRLREVCGSFSGILIVLGLLYGYDGPETGEVKKEQYRRVQELAKEFEKINGGLVCRELLHLENKRDEPTPEARTPEYYKKRPCPEIIKNAALILEEYLQTDGRILENYK